MSERGLFLLCATVLVVCAVDDARDLPAKWRLAVQVALGGVLVYGSGVALTTFGDSLSLGGIELGGLGPLVAIAAVIGANNAASMAWLVACLW